MIVHLNEDAAKFKALNKIVKWGYPREITYSEWSGGIWIEFHDRAIIWFEKLTDDAMSVHACANPYHKGEVGTPENIYVLEVVAQLLGAKKLYAYTPTQNPQNRAMRRYMRIRGWREDELGTYKEFGNG